MTVIAVIVLVLFALAFLAIVVHTVRSGRPEPSRRLHGGQAIEDAISRYDRRQRYNWYERFWH